MALGDEIDEIFRREVKSLPAYAKAQGAAGSGVAPPVGRDESAIDGPSRRGAAVISPARRPHRRPEERLKELVRAGGGVSPRGNAPHCHGPRKIPVKSG